jgi:succinate dehydrogenase / fumarate reductase cytochrome b subunit
MSWLKQLLGSSIGGKFLVAITGLGMVGFLIAHVSGNLLIFTGTPDALAEYAEGLRKFPVLLLGLRVGLIVMTVVHVVLAIKLNLANQAARPIAYQKKRYIRATFASRTMVYTGLLVLFYAVYHLAHFTWRVTNPEIGALGPWEVYRMLILSFQDPVQVLLYVLAMIVLGLHLSHGISSLFQSMGLNHPKYNGLIRALGPTLGTLLALAYISIPMAVFFGIVR